jgi:hypothetical protein
VRWDIGVLAPGAISCVDLTVIVNAPPGAQVSNSVSVHSGVYVATRPPYLTDITENTVLGLALTVDTISLSTPVVLEEFGSLEVGG